MLGSKGGDHVAETGTLYLTPPTRAGPVWDRTLEVPELRASFTNIPGPGNQKFLQMLPVFSELGAFQTHPSSQLVQVNTKANGALTKI